MLRLRPRLLEKLEVNNRRLSKDKKTHLNITAIFNIHIPITKTKSIRLYVKGLAISL